MSIFFLPLDDHLFSLIITDPSSFKANQISWSLVLVVLMATRWDYPLELGWDIPWWCPLWDQDQDLAPQLCPIHFWALCLVGGEWEHENICPRVNVCVCVKHICQGGYRQIIKPKLSLRETRIVGFLPFSSKWISNHAKFSCECVGQLKNHNFMGFPC